MSLFAARTMIQGSDEAPRSRDREAWIVAAVAIAASIGGLFNDFVYDDIPIVRDNARLHDLGHWREILTRPYWPPPFVEQLYRPFASLLLSLEYVLGGGAPIVFRVASYLLYVAASLATLALARRVLTARAALLAAILFAVHPVHVEAVALAVNQGELIVGLLAALAACRYIDARRRGGFAVNDWVLIAEIYAVATMSKENGYVIPLLLLACEFVVGVDESVVRRAAAVWRGFALMGAIAGAALLIRAEVLPPAQLAASPAQALRGLGLSGRILLMLQVVPMWLRLFVWPAHLQADFAPGEIVAAGSLGVAELFGAALVVTVLASIWAARRRAPAFAFGLAWCVGGLLPVSNLVPSGIVLAERTLFLPSIGVVIAAGAVGVQIARAGERRQSRRVRPALVAAVAILALLGIARSEGRHRAWNSRHLVVRPSPPPRS